MVKSWLQLQPHPFRVLLYVEWVLLGITALYLLEFPYELLVIGASIEELLEELLAPLLLTVLMVGLFGILGLRLPAGKLSARVAYLGLAVASIGLAAFTFECFECFSPLLLIVAIRSCLILPRLGQIGVASVTFVWVAIAEYFNLLTWELDRGGEPFLIFDPDFWLNPGDPESQLFAIQFWVQAVLLFALALILVFLLVNALLAERRSWQELALARDRLRQYSLRIGDQATLQERNRIAREIHDSLGHLLATQSIQLENALFFLPPDASQTQPFLEQGKALGSQALNELRRSVAMLRTDPLQGKTLEAAIAELLHRFQQTTGIRPNQQVSLPVSLPAEFRTALYRILEEALTNICKHSQATTVTIRLQTDIDVAPERAFSDRVPTLSLEIADNGRGFTVRQNLRGFGLQGMQERVTSLGGQIAIASQPGAGCQIAIRVPLPETIL